ncbi:uncharacterized protein Dlip2 [Palaemon carinicauda]|uniref:uncharacterized protein Dlip2 n=1 Tax=Palaemon carinicauda TaxID=392227 RepID=UPI0035B69EC0
MTGCSAFGCTNRAEKGSRLFRFPSNPERRKIWRNKVNRLRWEPSANSFLCEDHFEEDQIENRRIDGKRKLRWNAIPTLFSYRSLPKRRKPPVQRGLPDRHYEEYVRLDHAYCKIQRRNSISSTNGGNRELKSDRNKRRKKGKGRKTLVADAVHKNKPLVEQEIVWIYDQENKFELMNKLEHKVEHSELKPEEDLLAVSTQVPKPKLNPFPKDKDFCTRLGWYNGGTSKVKEEVDYEYYRSDSEEALIQDTCDVKEELDIKEELVEPKFEPSDTEIGGKDMPEYVSSTGVLNRWKMPQNSGCFRGVRITSQSRKIVMNVHRYLRSFDERECETSVNEKTAAATGVSMSSLNHIKKQARGGRFKSPPPRVRDSVVRSIDADKEEKIRKAILSFYERRELPTMDAVRRVLKGPPFKLVCARASLQKLTDHLGFRCRRIQGVRVVLIEKNYLVAARNKYLRLLIENRTSDNPRPEIYVSKTCVTLNGNGIKPRQKKVTNEYLVIGHAGGEDGFVSGAFLSFRSRSKNKVHYSMNSESFQFWFQNHVLPNIPSQSLIIMDISPSHSSVSNKVPTRSSKKCDVIKWLTQNNIEHESFLSKAELLQLVSLNKYMQVYEIDEIAKKHGHLVIRIPPFHYSLNPMEFIWQEVKLSIRKANHKCPQTLDKVGKIARDVTANITKKDWKRFISDSRYVEEDYRSKDLALERALESVVLSCDDLSSDSDVEYLA